MSESRSYDGRDNNKDHPEWGQAGRPLRRMIPSAYADGISKPKKGANPRRVSTIVCSVNKKTPHSTLSNYMWAWGQYLDHQLDLTPGTDDSLDIKTPAGDPYPEPGKISFNRSAFDPSTSTSKKNPRQQINISSSYMDSSNVYGSSFERANLLRRHDGSGKLKTIPSDYGDLLPFNIMKVDNDQGPVRKNDPPHKFFAAGDLRVNEHNVLTCMHTLFVREHNRLCDNLAKKPSRKLKNDIADLGPDEAIYQHARRTVGAIEQAITYEAFLPALLGDGALTKYTGYKKNVDPTICNIFSTVVYRLGHDMLGSKLLIVPPKGKKESELKLRDAFWKPERIEKDGIDGFLNGLAKWNMEKMDGRTVEDVRTLLFNVFNPKSKELADLAALNIQRGRDHGIPSYNDCRVALGLKEKKKFEDISSVPETAKRLEKAYKTVDRVDPWVGGLSENHRKDAVVGEFFFKVLKDQFQRLRDGDRFWYENDPALTTSEKAAIKKTTLAQVILRNTEIKTLQDNVFLT